MSMLPSPIIEGTLPAFYLDNDRGTATIAVPFSMSRAVNKSEVKGFRLKLKYIQNGDTLMAPIDHSEIDYTNYVVKFLLPKESIENNFKLGSFYKAQLAYIGLNNTTGYYSSVGIIKYTSRPRVSILNLEKFSNNAHTYEYTGEYNQESYEDDPRDATEKVYSYRFVIAELEGKIIKDTGFIIHNYSYDTDYYRSKDTFFFSQDLDLDKKYTITYTVKTNNGLEISSPSYRIISKQSVINRIDASLKANLNYNNGYVNLMFQGALDEQGIEKTLKGSFLLTRSSNKTDFTYWEELDRFDLVYQRPSSKTWTDFTVEQGLEYKYSIQQYNKNGLYSERLVSNIIYADFEDSFLYDGERQLKIKFNPKVTSFKKDILESKVETIGSQYPFIFRNGSVEYKEFPISGLISYLMDEEFLFFSEKDIFIDDRQREYKQKFTKIDFPKSPLEREREYRKNYLFYYFEKEEGVYQRWINHLREKIIEKNNNNAISIWDKMYNWYNWTAYEEEFKTIEDKLYLMSNVIINPVDLEKDLVKTTNEVSYNIQLERMFKLEVLDWLTNGKPKLFRSPTEGNYLVRLLNSSLSPQDQLGRMLHTFSSTAYEIADISHEVLVSYGIRKISKTVNNKYLKMVTIPFMTKGINTVKEYINYINYPLNSKIYYATGNLIPDGVVAEWATVSDMKAGDEILVDGQSIIIGSSGTYEIPFSVSQITLGKMKQVENLDKETFDKNPGLYYIIDNLFKYTKVNSYIEGAKYYKAECPYSTGKITYSYMEELNDSFDQLTDTDLADMLGRQIIGENNDVIKSLEDTVRKVAGFYDIKVKKRPIIELFIKEENSAFNAYDSSGNKIGEIRSDKLTLPDEKTSAEIIELLNPLNLYFYKMTSASGIERLYQKVVFEDTAYSDRMFSNNNRHIDRRTSTNEYLKDYRDYYLYRDAKKLWKLNKKSKSFNQVDIAENLNVEKFDYYIQESIEFIYDNNAQKLYLSEKSYKGFEEMYKAFDIPEEDQKFYPKFQTSIYVDDEERDISVLETKYFRTGAIKPELLKTTVGVYLELFYLEQSLDYDIYENISLTQKKERLEEFKMILSTHYMMEQCIDKNSYKSYIDSLDLIYGEKDKNQSNNLEDLSYKELYNLYLTELDVYLEEVSKED